MTRLTLFITVALCAVANTGCRGSGASSQTPSLVTHDVGARPREIAVADLNDDGRRDVVVANSGDGTVTILIGTGDRGLQPLVPAIPCGNEPSDVDVLDVDNDHDTDLVVANHETSRITVLLNDGHANFTAAADSPLDSGARPHVHGLATGDFNGDGWIDVAVESADTREVRVFFNSREGFGNARGISVGTMPYHRLGVADVTGDGRVDILVPGHGNNSVVVVYVKQDLLTTTDWTLALAAQPWMVVGDDVNGDQRNDIVAVVSDGVSVWLGGLDGFTEAPGSPFAIAGATEVATGDVDGDGIADIAVGPWEGREVTILTGRSFARRTVRACERPIGLAVADLDGDHRAELCVACAKENPLCQHA